MNTDDFSSLVKKKNIKKIIIYGDAIDYLNSELIKYNHIETTYYFKDAILKSINISNKNDCVLLSPAFSSFDQFDNYKSRGECFKKIIKEHINAQ